MNYPIKMEWNGKNEMNLRVLKQLYGPAIESIILTLSHVTIFHYIKESWQKLQIYGPLFLTRIIGETHPRIIVLNSSTFQDPQDYTLQILAQTKFRVQKNVVYILCSNHYSYAFATESEIEAQNLANYLDKQTPLPGHLFTDPTCTHLLKMFSN